MMVRAQSAGGAGDISSVFSSQLMAMLGGFLGLGGSASSTEAALKKVSSGEIIDKSEEYLLKQVNDE